MRKAAVIWFDKNRNKYRVSMGRGQKTHIGRYDSLKEAKAAEKASVKAYRLGWNDAVDAARKGLGEIV